MVIPRSAPKPLPLPLWLLAAIIGSLGWLEYRRLSAICGVCVEGAGLPFLKHPVKQIDQTRFGGFFYLRF